MELHEKKRFSSSEFEEATNVLSKSSIGTPNAFSTAIKPSSSAPPTCDTSPMTMRYDAVGKLSLDSVKEQDTSESNEKFLTSPFQSKSNVQSSLPVTPTTSLPSTQFNTEFTLHCSISSHINKTDTSNETNVPNGDVPDTLNCVPDPSFNFVFDEPEPTLMKEAAEFSLLEPSLRPSLPNKELLPEGGGASNITNEGDEVNEVKDSTDPNTDLLPYLMPSTPYVSSTEDESTQVHTPLHMKIQNPFDSDLSDQSIDQYEFEEQDKDSFLGELKKEEQNFDLFTKTTPNSLQDTFTLASANSSDHVINQDGHEVSILSYFQGKSYPLGKDLTSSQTKDTNRPRFEEDQLITSPPGIPLQLQSVKPLPLTGMTSLLSPTTQVSAHNISTGNLSLPQLNFSVTPSTAAASNYSTAANNNSTPRNDTYTSDKEDKDSIHVPSCYFVPTKQDDSTLLVSDLSSLHLTPANSKYQNVLNVTDISQLATPSVVHDVTKLYDLTQINETVVGKNVSDGIPAATTAVSKEEITSSNVSLSFTAIDKSTSKTSPLSPSHDSLPPTPTNVVLPPTQSHDSLPPILTRDSVPSTRSHDSLPPILTRDSVPPRQSRDSLPHPATPPSISGRSSTISPPLSEDMSHVSSSVSQSPSPSHSRVETLMQSSDKLAEIKATLDATRLNVELFLANLQSSTSPLTPPTEPTPNVSFSMHDSGLLDRGSSLVTDIQDPFSKLQDPISTDQDPLSKLQDPVSTDQDPLSKILVDPTSKTCDQLIQDRLTTTQDPVSIIQEPVTQDSVTTNISSTIDDDSSSDTDQTLHSTTEHITSTATVADVTTTQPIVADVTTSKPTVANLTTSKPVADLTTSKPTVADLTTSKPTVADLTTTQPTVADTVVDIPIVTTAKSVSKTFPISSLTQPTLQLPAATKTSFNKSLNQTSFCDLEPITLTTPTLISPSIEAPQSVLLEGVCCVGGAKQMSVSIGNVSTQWIQCFIKLSHLYHNDIEISIESMRKIFSFISKCFVAPGKKETIKITFNPQDEGVYRGVLEFTSSQTNSVLTSIDIIAKSENPHIQFLTSNVTSTDINDPITLNFGPLINNTNTTVLPLYIINHGQSSVPLTLSLNTSSQYWFCYSLSVVSDVLTQHQYNTTSSSTIRITVPPNEVESRVYTLMVQFTPPTKSINYQETAEQYLSEIEVFVDTSNSNTFKLCTIPLSAIVGVSRLCIPRSMQELNLSCAVNSKYNLTVPLKNAGNLSLKVKLELLEPVDYISVHPDLIVLEPNERQHIQITFKPFSVDILNINYLMLHVLQNGPSYQVKLNCTVISDDHSLHPHTATDHSLHPHTATDHSLHPHTSTDHSLHPHTSTDHSLHPHTSTDHSLHPHIATDHSLHPHIATDHSLHPHTSTDHSLHPHTSTDHSLHPHTATDHSLHPHTATDHSLHPHTSTDHSLHPHTATDHSLHPHTATDHSSHPHTSTDHSLHPHTATDHSSHPHTATDHSLHPHTATDHSLHPHTATDHSLHPHTSTDHSLHPHTATDHSSHPHTATDHSLHPHTSIVNKILLKQSIEFIDTPVKHYSENYITINNPYPVIINWKINELAPTFFKESTEDICLYKTNYNVFWLHQYNGTISPYQSINILVAFQPLDIGIFTHIKELEITGHGISTISFKISFSAKATPLFSTTMPTLFANNNGNQVTDKIDHASPEPKQQVPTRLPWQRHDWKKVYIDTEYVEFPVTDVNKRRLIKIRVINKDISVHQFHVIEPHPPFSIVHHQFELTPRHCARLPIYFTPTKPGTYQSILAVKTESGHQMFSLLKGSAN